MKRNIKFVIIFVFVFSLFFVANSAFAYYNYNACNSHAYRLCEGNSIYWYDSCHNRQELYQSCFGTNQTCEYGQCVYQKPAPPPAPYILRYITACYNNNLYWYDNLGSITSFHKSCNDANSCTQDTCYSGICANTLKCDGSTCQKGTDDYVEYCKVEEKVAELSVLFFTKQEATSNQWQKSVEVGQNSKVYFMATIENTGSESAQDVIVFAEIPTQVTSLGNLEIDGVLMARDIISGVNIGGLEAGSSKTLTFEGNTQFFAVQKVEPAVIKAEADNLAGDDFIDIDFNPALAGSAAISEGTDSAFWEFVKRWYLWILVGVVLIFLFIVVFRRLSTNA